MTSFGGRTYSWLGRQLQSINGLATYTYNMDGQRIRKKTANADITYYYNGDILAGQKNGNTVTFFMYDENGDYIGFNYAGMNFYYIKNAQNDVIAIANTWGNILCHYEYDAWGKVISITGDVAWFGQLNPIRYRSYYYDNESGLYYLKSRYYNPEIGRFICADGYVSTAQGMLSHNMFAYCNNNPVMYCDPSGRFSVLAGVVCALIAICTVVGAVWGASSDEKLIDKTKDNEKGGSDSFTPNPTPPPIPNNTTEETESKNSIQKNQNKTPEPELTSKDRVVNTLIGASLGMAAGGAASMLLISMPAIMIVGPTVSSQAFSIGALAFNFVAIVVAPFFSIDLEPIEWDSVDIDNTN